MRDDVGPPRVAQPECSVIGSCSTGPGSSYLQGECLEVDIPNPTNILAISEPVAEQEGYVLDVRDSGEKRRT